MAATIAIASTTLSTSAGAAPGDYAYAHAQFLQGSIAGQALDQLIALAGEEAESHGSSPDGPHVGNLDLTLLGLIPLQVPGGIQLPLEQIEVGTLGQYAMAHADGRSTAAVGAITQDGVIGTGIDPATQMGALTLSLDGLLGSLNLPTSVLGNIASLELMIDGISARATQNATSQITTSEYSIGDVHLVLRLPAVGQLVSTIESTVLGPLGTLLGQLETEANGLLVDILDALPANLIDVDIQLTGLDSVSTLLSSLTTVEGPGLRVDLVNGFVEVDLDELLELNGRPANTVVLTPEVLGTILANVTQLLNSVVASVNNAIGSIGVTIEIDGQQVPLSVGGLLGATLGGLLGLLPLDGLGLDLDQLIADLASQINLPVNLLLNTPVGNLLNAVQVAVTPLLNQLTPVFDAVNDVLRLTVNVQETTPINTQAAGDQFTVRALRLELLPGTLDLVHLDLANATVGPNTAGSPTTSTVPGACVITITGINPASGSTTGGNLVTLTGSGFNAATSVTFGDTPATSFLVINDATIEALAPAHAPGQVTVTVGGASGCSAGTFGYEFVTTPDDPGTTTPTTLPTTSTPEQPASEATLPATGNDTAGSAAAVGGVLTALGAGLLLIARRRTAASAGG